ncbi:coiled-coil domain-containing protein 7 [Camelus ferus]|uniref:Coiled-coil domain-containing protein 7 n=1 Tax=Camelus ferus TaxID=419612 RepID=A0A8B8SJG6_CAMFR|nr:coiled-coil domain-containing protein 7 [Camelus ferus]
MKPVKHLLASSSKLANVPALTYKRGLLNSPLSPKLKEKHSAKLDRDKLEPMVLRSPPTGESMIRYALPIPSRKTKELIAEDESIRKISERLRRIVSTFEETYGFNVQNEKEQVVKPEDEGLTSSVGDDLNSFLTNCSEFATQLEEAADEKCNILESLFKWFQRQVNQMEEISKGQTFSRAEFPLPDKTVSLSIARLAKQLQILEELRNCLKGKCKYSFKETSKPKDTESPPAALKSYESIEHKIDEFLKAHSTEEMADVSATEPKTGNSVINRLNAMLRVFGRQANTLQRAMNDKALLEAKNTEIQNDLQVLSEEKSLLENELQKLKSTKKTKVTSDRTKKTLKMEKKKEKEKSEDLEEKKSVIRESKVKEDTHQVQKATLALEIENKVLREQLQLALQESERAKHQLDCFLNQEKELLRSEGKSKTATEMGTGKIKVKREDSKYTPLEKEVGRALVADSGGQKTNGKVEHLQILESQDGSHFLKSSDDVLADGDLFHILSSETRGKSFTGVLPSKEMEESQSPRASLPGSDRPTAPFVAPTVVIKRKPLETDISKATISEENLQSKTEKQTYQEERELDAQDEESDGSLLPENEVLSKPDTPMLRQRGNRRTAFLITEPNDMLSVRDQWPAGIALMLRSQLQIKNLRAAGSDSFDTQDKVPDGNLTYEHQALPSTTQEQANTQRTPGGETDVTHDEGPAENPVLEHQDSVLETQLEAKKQRPSEGKRLSGYDRASYENRTPEHQEPASETQPEAQRQREKRLRKSRDDIPDRNPVLKPQDSVLKLQMQVQKQVTSGRGRPDSYYGAPDKDLTFVNQDSVSKPQVQVKKQITSKGERRHTFPLENQKKNTTTLGNLPPEREDLFSRNQSQAKKLGATRKEDLDTQKAALNLLTEEEVELSKNQPQTKKLWPVEMETLSNVDELSDETFTLNDVESAAGYKDQIQTSGVYLLERLGVKNKAASELPDTAENLPDTAENLPDTAENLPDTAGNLPEMNPSVSDLIFQLGLNKVVETDLERLKDTVGRRLLAGEVKIEPKSLPETNTESFPDIIGRGIVKTEIKTWSKSHLGTKVERLAEKIQRNVMNGEFKVQSMHLPETDTERFPGAVGKGLRKGEVKTQSKSHLGVNLFEDKDMSPQHQADLFTWPIAPAKFSTNKINVSPVDSQGMNLLENKNAFSHQDLYSRHNTASKYTTRVIHLAPFDNEEEPSEYFSPPVTGHPKPLHRALGAGPSAYKTKQLPSPDKGHSVPGKSNRKTKHEGHQKKLTSGNKKVDLKDTLPAMISTAAKPIYKGKESLPYKGVRNETSYRGSSDHISQSPKTYGPSPRQTDNQEAVPRTAAQKPVTRPHF